MQNSKKAAIILLSLVVMIWGGEYSVGKILMDTYSSVNVLMFKYIVGIFGLGTAKFFLARHEHTAKRDIPMFLIVTFFGVVMYFVCDYQAMEYIPISLVTIVLAFVPIVSIIIDRVWFKRKMTGKIIIGVIGSVVGVAIVIGPDVGMLMQGKLVGYLLAFGAVISWNMYNFIMEPLSNKYSYVTLGFNQVLCAFILVLPMQIGRMPDMSQFTPGMLVGVLYLGLCSALIGYMVMPMGLRNLGPTVTGIFSNFLPITSTFFGWVVLGQSLGPVQLIGCAVVIAFSCLVIIEVGKRDSKEREEANEKI